MQINDAIQLVTMEYREMPDMRLTFHQVQRLWCLSAELCAQVLTALTESGFLFRTCEGFYVRNREAGPSVQAITGVLRAMQVS